LTIGTTTVSTFRVFQTGRWQKIAFSVSNVDFSSHVYINGEERPTTGHFPAGVSIAQRSGTLGFCADGTKFSGHLDNFVIINDILSSSDVELAATQFVPFLNSQDLVMYYPFNDVAPDQLGGTTVGIEGSSANTFLNGVIDNSVQGVIKSSVDKENVADAVCAHSGVTLTNPVADPAQNLPPFFGSAHGGATQNILCLVGDKSFFTVNQFWDSKGGITQLAIKTSDLHYWKISAPGLKVEHRTWGGWSVLPRGADLIQYDHTSYKFTDDSVMIQSGHYGYIKITEKAGLLNYIAA